MFEKNDIYIYILCRGETLRGGTHSPQAFPSKERCSTCCSSSLLAGCAVSPSSTCNVTLSRFLRSSNPVTPPPKTCSYVSTMTPKMMKVSQRAPVSRETSTAGPTCRTGFTATKHLSTSDHPHRPCLPPPRRTRCMSISKLSRWPPLGSSARPRRTSVCRPLRTGSRRWSSSSGSM